MMVKYLLILLCFGWFLTFLKNLTIIPSIDWVEREITGIQVNYKWRF